MRVFKTKGLARFARREGLSDLALRDAILRAARGLVDAELGDGLIKQRVARAGQGRSGGYQMMIAYRQANRAVQLFGFAKSDQIIWGRSIWMPCADWPRLGWWQVLSVSSRQSWMMSCGR
jgi:hypothetical protein